MSPLRLAPLLLAACALDPALQATPTVPPPAPVAEAALPPTAHEWDHGPPWEAGGQPWGAPPAWAAQPAQTWDWGATALGPWVAAPTVSIGIGTGYGWWWGYRPWPRYGWWGPSWSPAPVWRPYGWAYRPWVAQPWPGPAWGYRPGWGYHRPGWGYRPGWHGRRRW